jgi:adenylate cyclase
MRAHLSRRRGTHLDPVIDAIHAAGGDVLKLIGDGTLAIFSAPDPAQACGQLLPRLSRPLLRLPPSANVRLRPG